jgi:hypothetical protein
MEMLTSVVPFGLVGGALAAALWAWHEIRDVAMGGMQAHRRPRELLMPARCARARARQRAQPVDGKLKGSA